MYGLSDLSLIGSDGKIELMVHQKADVTSKAYNIELAETNHEFSFNFIEKNVMIMPGPYTLEMARLPGNNFAARFSNKNQDLEYYISSEPDSSYV
jgi:hypothetical protein